MVGGVNCCVCICEVVSVQRFGGRQVDRVEVEIDSRWNVAMSSKDRVEQDLFVQEELE